MEYQKSEYSKVERFFRLRRTKMTFITTTSLLFTAKQFLNKMQIQPKKLQG
jgi:hypothetical protein